LLFFQAVFFRSGRYFFFVFPSMGVRLLPLRSCPAFSGGGRSTFSFQAALTALRIPLLMVCFFPGQPGLFLHFSLKNLYFHGVMMASSGPILCRFSSVFQFGQFCSVRLWCSFPQRTLSAAPFALSYAFSLILIVRGYLIASLAFVMLLFLKDAFSGPSVLRFPS